MPDRAVVELEGRAVRRKDRARVPVVGPDAVVRCECIRPGARGSAGIVDEIEVGSVLRDEGGGAGPGPAIFDASPGAGQVGKLR